MKSVFFCLMEVFGHTLKEGEAQLGELLEEILNGLFFDEADTTFCEGFSRGCVQFVSKESLVPEGLTGMDETDDGLVALRVEFA